MIDNSVKMIDSRIVIFIEFWQFEYYKGMSTFDSNIGELKIDYKNQKTIILQWDIIH